MLNPTMQKSARILVKPGEIRVSKESSILETVVHEGVCVCMLAHESKVGGLVHFTEAQSPDSAAGDARYGDVALFKLLKGMTALAPGEHYSAAIVGGAFITEQDAVANANLAMAHEYLELQEIPLVLNEERGSCSRRVVFNTSEGLVKVTTL